MGKRKHTSGAKAPSTGGGEDAGDESPAYPFWLPPIPPSHPNDEDLSLGTPSTRYGWGTEAIAVQSVEFPKPYPADPQDRIIGATAVVEGRPLLTQDRLIVKSGLVPLAG